MTTWIGQLIVALTVTFVGVAVLSGLIASAVLARSSPERRRLRELTAVAATGALGGGGSVTLTDRPDAVARRVSTFVPKSPKEMGRLQKRLTRAGFKHTRAAVFFAVAEVLLPLAFALATIWCVGVLRGGIFALLAAGVGYAARLLAGAQDVATAEGDPERASGRAGPVDRLCRGGRRAGRGHREGVRRTCPGLPRPGRGDAAHHHRDARRQAAPGGLQEFAARTGVDDVRPLVAMLVQTDKFGTSIAQALRTHAATSRTKRRQRAEERAAKLGVKLVFPLVFCLFPALYVVVLGPAVIKMMESLM